MYIVIQAHYYNYEGYDFPQIEGIFKTKASALKKFPKAVEDSNGNLYEEEIALFLIGPLKISG